METPDLTQLIRQIERAIETTKTDPNATRVQKIWKTRGQETVLDQIKEFFNLKQS